MQIKWILLTLLTLTSLNSLAQELPYTSQDLDQMTPNDRAILAAEERGINRFLTKHCTRDHCSQTGRCTPRLEDTCGRMNINNGDPGFKPEILPQNNPTRAFASIPKNSQVEVHTKCHADGKFYTSIKINGKPWANPYCNPKTTKCITSPGQYLRNLPPNASQADREFYRTTLPISRNSASPIPASGYITAWHIVSSAQTYEGAQMPWAVWLKNKDVNDIDGDGNREELIPSNFAYHAETGDTPADGYPASAGCLRMKNCCAQALFNLYRRVGARRVATYWYGYRNDKGELCDRPSNVANPLDAQITPTNSRRAINRSCNGLQRFVRWLGLTRKSCAPSQETAPATTEEGVSSDR